MTNTTTTPVAERPQIMQIPVSRLKVKFFDGEGEEESAGYQRKPDAKFRKLVEKMKREFIPDLYAPLSVAEWEGEYFVYDGNARRTLAAEVGASAESSPGAADYFGHAGDPTLECRVTPNCEPNRQAWLFVKCNEERRGMPWINRHQANLFQKDAVAIEIERIVRLLGMQVGKGYGNVSAVQALYSTISPDEEGGPLKSDLLTEVLTVAKKAWFDGRPSRDDTQYAFSDRTLDALALVLSTFPASAMDRDELIYKLSQVLVKDLINRTTSKTSAHGSNNVTMLATEFARQYNKMSDIYPDRRLRLNNLDPKVRRAKAKVKASRSSKRRSR